MVAVKSSALEVGLDTERIPVNILTRAGSLIVLTMPILRDTVSVPAQTAGMKTSVETEPSTAVGRSSPSGSWILNAALSQRILFGRKSAG